MRVDKNNLVFEYQGDQYNVPLGDPWNLYVGETKAAAPYQNMLKKVETRDGSKYFVLLLTENCNMACKYCVYGKGSHKAMSIETIDEFFSYLKKNSYDDVTLVLFGGEPLLEIEKIKYIIKKAEEEKESLKVQYLLFTNGLLLTDETVELIKKHKIGVTLSLDGTKAMHDIGRVYKNGKGTYDDVISKTNQYRKIVKNLMISGVYDTQNLSSDFIEICDNLSKNGLGFYSLKFPYVSSNSDYAVTEEKGKQIVKMIEDYTEECLKRIKKNDFSLCNFFNVFQIVLMLFGHRSILTTTGCNMGKNLCSVGCEGKIYPCQAFIGNEDYVIGDLKNGIDNSKLHDELADFGYDDVKTCAECPIKYMCSDLCAYNFYVNGGKEHEPNHFRCEIYKAFIKSSFYLFYELKKLPVQSMKLKLYYTQFLDRPW